MGGEVALLDRISEDAKGRLRKIALLSVHAASEESICEACGLGFEELKLIQETNVFKEMLEIVQSEKFEEYKIMDKGWDGIEQQAMSTVIDNLKFNKDPKFALQAAFTANKASRRNVNNRPIDPRNNGSVVLNLQQTFISRVESGMRAVQRTDVAIKIPQKNQEQQNGHGITEAITEAIETPQEFRPVKKAENALSISATQDLLESGTIVGSIDLKHGESANAVKNILGAIHNNRRVV